MDPILAVYAVKLTVRTSTATDPDGPGVPVPTNDQVGEALSAALAELYEAGLWTVSVNATSVERTDD
jgi:hypothetical protein